jgi:Outer membrane lipoprotein-sorting protein
MERSAGAMQIRLGRLIVLQFAGVLGLSGFASAAHVESPAPSAESIISRMIQARSENRARLRPYCVTRNYKLFGKEKQTARSEVIARVTFDPPGIKQFVIQQASGMGLGERIVRQMLEHETEIGRNNASTDLSPANYHFRYLREEELGGRPCYVLEILPRRNDKSLLRGQIWVDSTTYLLHRTEGEPARSPSWWLKDARLVLTYGSVGGMWLQTSSESSADVRFLGRHTMLSRDVEYDMTTLAASTSVAPRGR